MDPPENSVNRIGRTIWTVWGYLSGAVARYLRPEVTAEGNQSVRARTDEESAVNKIDREVKTNNSDDVNERAEVKCSPSIVRAATSVQWDNIKSDNNDQLTTKKQTYNCAAWSAGTETDGEGRTAEKVSSDEVQAEEEHAICERETTQEVTGQTEQKDGDDKEECDENHEVEKCAENREDADDTDVMIQSEQDRDKQIETEDTGGLKHDEHPTDETEKQISVQKIQRKTERDEDQGTESQVQDLLEYLTDEANSISKPERLKAIDKYSDEVADVSKNQIEEMMLRTEDLEEIGRFEPKDGGSEERDQEHEVEKCDVMREDPGNTDVMIQSEQDRDEQINMTDRGETEDTGGLKDETEKQIIVQKIQRKTENDEVADVSKNQIEEMISGTEQDEESQTAQDLEEIGRFEPKDGDGELEYLTDEANGISKPERLKAIDKYSDEIADVSKSSVEEMMLGTEQDEDTTEREQDMTKYESAETLQREKQAPNDETELKTSTVEDETVDALEDTLLSDSENTPESGTGSSVLATKTEGMFSDLAVCEFPGEPRRGLKTDWGCFEEIQTKLHDPQSPAGERAERDAESETLIQTERQQTDNTELSLKQHVEFRTEVVVETKISSEDEEAEAFETESRSPVIRNVSLEPHQLLEFKMSQGTMDPFSETQGNSSVSEITSEDQTDTRPVSTRSLSPTELLEEPLDLQADVAKTALEYVEELTNQVLKAMIATECNLVGLSPEEPGDAEHQAQCVSADASVLEEELITSTVDSSEEHMSSAECVSADASVLEEEPITTTVDSSEEHMSSAECVSADASVLEEELITSTMDSSEEHMSSAECVSADASVLEEELIMSTVDSNEEHMSLAQCVSADASVLEEELITSTMDSSEEHMSSAECVSADASVLEEEPIMSTVDSSEEHMSSAECVSADASVLEEERITSTVDSSEEHMSEAECVSADASVLEEEPITTTVDSSEEHMSSAECVSADASVLEEELITSTVDSSEEHMSSAECVSADASVLEEEPITSTMDSSEEHMSSAECVSAEASVLEEEPITTTVDSSEEHMSSAECVSADASVLEEELITSTVDSNEEHMSAAECVSADASVLEEELITSTVDSSEEHMSSAQCVSADASVLEEELITSTVDSNEEHMSAAECVSADASVLEEELITSTVDSSEEHMSSAECVSADASVLEEEPITSTVDSSGEHMSSAECVSADASVLEEEPITSTVDSSGEHMSSAECESTDGRHEQMQKSIAGETVLRSQEDLMEVSRPVMKRGFDQMSKGLLEVKTEGKFDLILQAFEDSSLDFSVQKSRIAVKNPLIRPPKDPRKLLSKASVEPRPQPSDRSQTLQVSAPSKAMIGFKLPGLPVLRRTEFVPKAEAQRTLQTQQKSVTEDSVKQEQVPAKPKWTPPRHPGMGSPFMMAELKNKLKKPVQE